VVLIPGPLYHGGPFLIGITSLFHGNHLVLQSRFSHATKQSPVQITI
jgi:hypothetical protein